MIMQFLIDEYPDDEPFILQECSLIILPGCGDTVHPIFDVGTDRVVR